MECITLSRFLKNVIALLVLYRIMTSNTLTFAVVIFLFFCLFLFLFFLRCFSIQKYDYHCTDCLNCIYSGLCSAGYFCVEGSSSKTSETCTEGDYCPEGVGLPLRCPPVSMQQSLLTMIWTRSGVRCSSVVKAFAHGAMGRRIDPSWGGPIELFLIQASAP